MIIISRLYIILGNGFSIDLIEKLGKSNEIDLINLFNKGAEVPWPETNKKGFLSYKYCNSLWTLGAKTTLNTIESNKLIEDIITCINVYNYSRQNHLEQKDSVNNIYIKAYAELTTYLRYLFIYYNSKITDKELKAAKVPLINYLIKMIKIQDEIIIIDYNYDIWLERLLKINKIEFNIEGFENNKSAKIKIFKPHGSISFSFKIKITGPFSIRNLEIVDFSQNTNQFNVEYNLNSDFPIVNAIIPPAGDSNRCNMGWIKTLRNRLDKKLKLSANKDILKIFGISYWHVDRNEVDEILTKINSDIDAFLINPSPPTCLNAVLTSLFKNYVHFTHSEMIEVND